MPTAFSWPKRRSFPGAWLTATRRKQHLRNNNPGRRRLVCNAGADHISGVRHQVGHPSIPALGSGPWRNQSWPETDADDVFRLSSSIAAPVAVAGRASSLPGFSTPRLFVAAGAPPSRHAWLTATRRKQHLRTLIRRWSFGLTLPGSSATQYRSRRATV